MWVNLTSFLVFYGVFVYNYQVMNMKRKKYTIQILLLTLILLSVFAKLYEKKYEAVSINLDGKSIGTVRDETVLKKAIEIANAEVVEEYPLGFFNPKYKLVKNYSYKTLDANEMSKVILENDKLLTNAWVVRVSGVPVIALYDRDEALDAISNFKQSFIDNNKRIIKSMDFLSNIEINYDEIDYDLVSSKDQFLRLMKESVEKTEISHYKKEGLTLVEEYEDLYIKRDALSFDVLTKDELEEKIILPASTIFKYDDSLDVGETKIEREGEDGVLFRKTENDYINDQIVKTVVITEKLISYPTSTIMLVGDRKLALRPQFQMPSYGVITSGYGPRYDGFHRGIDIAGPLGSEIKASAPGKVTFAGYLGTYGYVVFVKHNNGYETRYAHLLRIHAKEGDDVNTGDVLGEMGSSGNSTGAHLHFEILKDGQHLDPQTQL